MTMMRTRRAFKRTITILALLLILSAALNIMLIIMLCREDGQVQGSPEQNAAEGSPDIQGGIVSAEPAADATATPSAEPSASPTPAPLESASPSPNADAVPSALPTPALTPTSTPKASKRPQKTATPEPTASASMWVFPSAATPAAEENGSGNAQDTADKASASSWNSGAFGGGE